MIFNAALVVFWGTLFRPIVGAAVSIPKSTPLQTVPCLCTSIQEKSWVITSWSSTATSALKIA